MNRYAVMTRYPRGQSVPRTLPGDLVLTRRRQLASRLIGIGQGLRFRGPDLPYAHWTHVAVAADAEGHLIEALGHGVELTNIYRYHNVDYHYVRINADAHDRRQMARFARECIGRPYGWSEILSLGLSLVTGAKIQFGNPGTLICSALAAQTLCRGDYVFPRDPNRLMPADLAKALDVRP